MVGSSEKERETIRPAFDRSILIDFQRSKITSDTGFLLLREIDDRFGVLGPNGSELEDTRLWVHFKHSQLQMARERIYQIAAGYEDCNDANFLRIDPALCLPTGKGQDAGSGHSGLSRHENQVLGTDAGLKVLEDALRRSTDALIRRKKKQGLIVDVDSTEDPAHDKQENVAFNGHFGKTCFHPMFVFIADGDCLGSKLSRKTPIPRMAYSICSILSHNDVGLVSRFSRPEVTRRLPCPSCTSIANASG